MTLPLVRITARRWVINQQQRQQQPQTTALCKFPDGRTLSVTAPEAEVADVGVPRLSARYSMSYSFPLLDLDFCLIPLPTHRTTQEPCGWSPLPIKSCTDCPNPEIAQPCPHAV